ncbi:MAG: hypothetical protein AB7T37_02660 [Dehalococcoidia bacterium]
MATDRPVFWPEIRALLLMAMLVFLYTIGIGILNGIDAVDFDQRRILGHVHGGTLGWLTLAVLAASLWLFGESRKPGKNERNLVRVLTVVAIVAFPAYVAAFSLTYGNWRPALGIISLLPIAGFFAWVVYRARGQELGVPQWGFIAALGTSIAGGVLGVLLGLEIATGDNYLPTGGEDAHPATMVVGFLIPVALAMAEWAFFFPRPPKATRAGQIQMIFPFAGGVLLGLSLLLNIEPLAPLAILLELVGVIIFVVRMFPRWRMLNLLEATPGRYGLASAIAIIFVIGLAQYWIIKYEGDFDLVETHELLALDHSQFIGGMTNAIFAMLMLATVPGRKGGRIDQVIFLLVNIGIIGFVVGLLSDSAPPKHMFTPIMGAGLLLGLGTYAYRLLPEVFGTREEKAQEARARA